MIKFNNIKFGDKGFTLIELMIGLSIMSVGILAVAGMQIASIKGTTASRNVSDASVLGTDMVERLMQVNYNSAELDNNTATPAPRPIIDPTGNYLTDWKIHNEIDIDGDGNGDLKTITVTVSLNIDAHDTMEERQKEFSYSFIKPAFRPKLVNY